jgi:hypothetical protein
LPDIHGHIKDLSLYNPDQLSLGSAQLIVQAPKHAPCGIDEVVLHKARRDAMLKIPLGLIGLQEMAAVISEDIRLDNHYFRQHR